MIETIQKTLSIEAVILMICGIVVLTGCKHNMDDYMPQPYTTTSTDRLKYAEEALGVKIDPKQDWTLSNRYSVKVTVDADLENISQVAVLDGNPYLSVTNLLATSPATNNATVTLSFLAPSVSDIFYVACISEDGQCIARPFLPGEDTSVSFGDAAEEDQPASPRRAANFDNAQILDNLFYSNRVVKDFYSFRDAVVKILPEGKDNRSLIGAEDFRYVIEVRKNTSENYILSLCYIYGNGSDNDNIWYNWYPGGQADKKETFLIKDQYKNKKVPSADLGPRKSDLTGHYLYRRHEGKNDIYFTPGDILEFHLANGETPMAEGGSHPRVKVFMFNGYVFIGCEDGDDWDYNDRLYWMPSGQDRIVKAKGVPVKTEPSIPQVWTYAWEDNTMEGNDRCDYDMNDCVIEVQEKAGDPTMLEITVVALGATRDLWLGFENKDGKTYKDYVPVFNNLGLEDQELHKLLGANPGEMVNTGNGTRNVKPFKATVKKPAGFDFQTNSFVLGAKVKTDMQGLYVNDYYMLHVSSAGTDPHGIVIPGQWQWPTERTSVKNAYPEFTIWASDRTKAKDWYKHPATGKVVQR